MRRAELPTLSNQRLGTAFLPLSYCLVAQGMRRHKASLDWQEQLRRGGLELAVMLTVAAAPRYGLDIIRHLEDLTDLVVTEGTIYPLLARLTRDGLLASEWNAEAAHPRKYYRLTTAGRRELSNMSAHWKDFSRKIDRLIELAMRQGRME
jgi:PadR family transcriptional regulator, regulatory protein PadR